MKKINGILKYWSLFFILQLILVSIWKDDLFKYGRAITNLFLALYLL